MKLKKSNMEILLGEIIQPQLMEVFFGIGKRQNF